MISASPSFISAWPTRPSGIAIRVVSAQSNARARKSIAPAASSYKRYGVIVCAMARRLRRRALRVLEKSFGRAAGHRAEVVDQMRLVVVAAIESNLRPGQRPRELARTLEPEQPGGCLRRQADFLAEARHDSLAAPAKLSCQLGDRDPAVSR